MNSNSTDFSLHALEARFEMQSMYQEIKPVEVDGGGGDYGYYGNNWDDYGSGDAYVGPYQEASDGSGAMLDDGTYTDGSSGSFPTYDTRSHPGTCWPTYPCSPPFPSQASKCTICRC